MKLQTISGKNIMGASFSLALSTLTILYGPSRSGKTRVRRAIELVLLGYVPTLDKTPRKIFKLSSGPEMEVEATMDNGLEINRVFTLKGDTVKRKDHVPKKLDGAFPAAMLDGNEYWSLTANKRVELVFRVANVGHTDAVALLAQIHEKFGAEAANMVKGGKDGDSPLELMATMAEAERSEAAAEMRRYAGTIQGLAELQLDDKASSRTIEAIDADIQKQQNAIAEAKAQKANAQHSIDAQEMAELERDDLKKKISDAGDPVPKEYDIDALRRLVQRLKAEILANDGRKHQHKLWSEEVVSAKADFEDAAAKFREAQKEPEPSEEQVRATLLAKFCRECGRPYDVTDEAVELSVAAIQSQKLERIEAARVRADGTREFYEGKKKEEPAQPPDDSVVRAQLAEAERQIDEYTQTADVQVWRKQLAAIPASKELVKPETFDVTIQEAEAVVVKLRAERQIAESDRQDRKRLAEARTAHLNAETKEKNFKALKIFLQDEKRAAMDEAFGPLLEIANTLTKGIIPNRVRYENGEFGYWAVETADNCFAGWVSEEVFCGAEQKILFAALQVALGAKSPMRIAIADEIGTIDEDAAGIFFDNVARAHKAGAFEQFIGFTNSTHSINLHGKDLKKWGFSSIKVSDNTYSTN